MDKIDRALVDERTPQPDGITESQLWRETAALKELLLTKLDEQAKAVILLQGIANRSPTVNEVFLQHEKKFDTVDVKFESVDKQFHERDVRTEQTGRDTKTAVDAALAAQEKAAGKLNESSSEAILKQEAFFIKQIDQLGELIKAVQKAIDDKFDDIKQRLTRLETERLTVDKSKTDSRDNRQDSRGQIAMIISIIIALFAVVGFLIDRIIK